MWGEGRGEPPEGWAAIAWVIRNRADRPKWWGHTLREVCLKPKQFSSWNLGDPNRQRMLDLPADDPLLRRITAVVVDVLAGRIDDPTGGATYYHTHAVDPEWDDQMAHTATIGAHYFYKDL